MSLGRTPVSVQVCAPGRHTLVYAPWQPARAVAAAFLGEGVAQGKRLLGEGSVWVR